jgi:Flp pilus assembly pilin Flp
LHLDTKQLSAQTTPVKVWPGQHLSPRRQSKRGVHTMQLSMLSALWSDDSAQDIAEYAVMLAVILVVVIATVKIIGGKSNNIFSEVASSIE